MPWHRLFWLALLSIPMLAVAAACGNDSDQPLALDAASFQTAYDELGTLQERALAGDVEEAEEAFQRIHVFTHLVNGALLDLPEAVLTWAALADAVVGIEQELEAERQLETLASLAADAQQALVDAAEEFGIDPPQEK